MTSDELVRMLASRQQGLAALLAKGGYAAQAAELAAAAAVHPSVARNGSALAPGVRETRGKLGGAHQLVVPTSPS